MENKLEDLFEAGGSVIPEIFSACYFGKYLILAHSLINFSCER
jgi:hypothetical protein